MGSEWKSVPLSELTKTPATYGVVQPGQHTPDGVSMIRVNNFQDHTFDLAEVLRISADVEAKYERTRIQRGDVLMTIVGSVGQVAVVPPALEGWNIARAVAMIRPAKPELSRWISFVLRSPIAQHQLGVAANTTVQTTINLKDLRLLQIPMPDKATRAGICELLGALDNRIDSLRQTNATLEAIAQALFKSWFVDFDPVRAKAEGREPEGMDAATAALFPGEFEDSELGPIPKGWRVEPFETQLDFTMGQSPPGSTYNTDRVGPPFFQGSTDFGDVFPVERVFCTQPTRFAREGDLLMSVRAPVGALNIAGFDCSIGRGLCAIRHNSGSTGLTYELVKTCMARIQNAAGEGALFKSLSKRQLASLPVLVPSSTVVEEMVTVLEPLSTRRVVNGRQVECLAKLRDTLLPRLVSGKIRVDAAQRTIAEAAG